MSYNVTISGHSVTETPDEAKQLEEQALAAARTFVNSLNDATSATFMGQHTGFADLMEKVAAAAEPTA